MIKQIQPAARAGFLAWRVYHTAACDGNVEKVACPLYSRLALALTVEVSIGLQLVDVERVQPWAVARAALGNAAVILGLSTVVESLYWLWRELTINGPALDWVPDPSKAESSVARVAHLSDLHVVVNYFLSRWLFLEGLVTITSCNFDIKIASS